ncbi:MAG TPA: hypothetical protein DEB39_12600 [Planctomycetaceae bacterium]|nr:hypothetical protein [Planctomycetaceae bacterium]
MPFTVYQHTLGIDEAGYGSNLGPLVVSASLWKGAPDPGAFPMFGDSKRLYTSHGSLVRLEQGVLGAIQAIDGRIPNDGKTLYESLGSLVPAERWERDFNQVVPIDAAPEVISRIAAGLEMLQAVRSRIIHAASFNRLLETDGNKSTLLTRQTLALMCELIGTLPEGGEVIVFADKHGGRNRYAAPLYERFPDAFIEIVAEGRESSVYRLCDKRNRRLEIHFETQGERHPQTALASMVSKYVRELAMRAFNAFWCREVESLRPTAGYPADAKRFYRDIDRARKRLEIAPESIWRSK